MSAPGDLPADGAFVRIRQALIRRTGHSYYADKDRALRDRVNLRMAASGCATTDDYAALLLGPEGEAEWRALEDEITIGETYFFRYPDHFHALRTRVLPDLLERRRTTRRLRIWSIGCANGAEPYSVAVLLREMLGPAVEDWRISLVGGDISERALALARRASYGRWALRGLGPELRERYFTTADGKIWTLRAEYRRLVRFERQNILDLLSDAPPLQWSEFDLILCRNVLIYFDPATAQAAIKALRNCLAAEGTLLLGHVESTLLDGAIPSMAPAALPAGDQVSEPSAAAVPLAPLPPVADVRPSPLPAVPSAASLSMLDAELDRLRRHVEAGEDAAARQLAQALLAAYPTAAVCHYHDAILHHDAGDAVAAEAALRRALYLDRGFVLAHHRLALLLLGTGRRDAGRRSLINAARLAGALPRDLPLPEGDGITAGEFGVQVRMQVDRLISDEAA
ncbi:MAG: protein-glutamate O-methyltransferase CheR [Alphaproteobacteria bacterium]